MSTRLKVKLNANKSVLEKLISTTLEEDGESKDSQDKIVIQLGVIKRKLASILSISEEIQSTVGEEQEMTEFVLMITDFEVYAETNITKLERRIKVQNDKVKNIISESASGSSKNVKLPRLIIEKFDGDYKKWQTFNDSFAAAVDSQRSLSNVEKFNYLKSYLIGDAMAVIEGLLLTNENYDKAMCLLKERFGNKQSIITAHMQELLMLRKIDNENDLHGIRQLYDKIGTHVRSLQSLGVQGDNYGTLLVPVIMERLPNEFKRHVNRAYRGGDCWDLTKLLDLIKDEIKVMETSATTGNNSFSSSFESSSATGATLYAGSKQKYMDSHSKTPRISCVFCKEAHWSDKCTIITDRGARKDFLKNQGLCYLCLRSGHTVGECKKSKMCYYCKGLHNSAICNHESSHVSISVVESNAASDEKTESNGVSSEQGISSTTKININEGEVLLQTADVTLKNKRTKREMKVKALFDSGSQRTYISEKACNFLKLPVEKTEFVNITTFGSKKSIPRNGNLVNVTALSHDQREIDFHALSFPNLCSSISRHSVQVARSGFDSISFADKGEVEGEVDLLIGGDLMWYFFTGNIVRSKICHAQVALETVFGWVLSGPSKAKPVNVPSLSTVQINLIESDSNKQLNDTLKKFWDLETIGIREEKPFEEIYSETIKRNDDTRYEVNLPFKENHPVVSDNYELSKDRLMKLHASLRKNPELLKKYDDIMKEQIEQGIIEPATEPGIVGETSYLPHRAVIREDKETTKVRLVFDASAKSKGPSLNDCLKKGPQLTPLLFDILLRFRSQIVALSADIEKAFHQISITPEDRDYLRFLWFDNIFSDQPTIIRNRFARVAFGVTSSPFCLNATIRKHAQSFVFDPEFVNTVIESFFVDDFIGGEINEERAFDLFRKLQLRFADGHFWLRKWRTNNAKLRKRLNTDTSSGKILGIIWDDNEDKLVFDLEEIYNTAKDLRPTKRNVLKIIASFYDPLGLIQPIVSTLKMLLQDIHRDKVQWDEELTGSLRDAWVNAVEQLRTFGKVEFDRCVEVSDAEVGSRELHGFSDASKKGYGACVYVRSLIKSGGVKVSLLTSKSRVAPLKPTTMPRLELLGNLLLSLLVSSVRKAYHLPFHSVIFWTDSKVTLAWIRSSKEFTTFVQNRLNEIKRQTDAAAWFYVSTNDNPADILTRTELTDPTTSFWQEGPAFLKQRTLDIVQLDDLQLPSEPLPEQKASTSVNASTITSSANNVIDFERFSSYKKLQRTTAWVLRFIRNVKAKVQNKSIDLSVILKSTELRDAEEVLVKANQEQMYSYSSKEVDDKFKQLNVQFDKNGILRCYGRIQNAPLPHDTVNPILLDSKHSLTRLIVLSYHKSLKHVLVKQTLTELRSKFWICRGRSFVRNTISKCVTCRKLHAKPYSYPENPSLSALRLSDARPFYATGVDNFGPVYLKAIYGRNTSYKAWVTLYTCASSRAILLDLVPQIDSKCFVRSFNRFIARRGCPDHMISDNGKNFVSSDTQNHIANSGIEWHFNLPLAPWHGGFFERLVRSVKELLRKELDRSKLNYEQLSTVLLEVEFILNNRPLTYVYPNDLEECVTPNHLLFGRKLNAEALNSHIAFDAHATADHHEVTTIIDSFWKRWIKEYVVNLREAHKFQKQNHRQPSPQVSDVVLIHDENQPRMLWRMGTITETIKSADNQIRGALVRSTTGSILKRPVNKLIPIEYVRYDRGNIDIDTDTNTDQPIENTVLNNKRREAAILGDLRRKFQN